jgi:hypothetical protein
VNNHGDVIVYNNDWCKLYLDVSFNNSVINSMMVPNLPILLCLSKTDLTKVKSRLDSEKGSHPNFTFTITVL